MMEKLLGLKLSSEGMAFGACDSELKNGDYVLIVEETHGWGEVEPCTIGIITRKEEVCNWGDTTCLYHVKLKEGSSFRWRGERECFRKVTDEVLNVGKAEEILAKLKQELIDMFNDGEVSVRLSYEFYGVFMHSGDVRYITMKLGEYVSTYDELLEGIKQAAVDNISTCIHESRITSLCVDGYECPKDFNLKFI